MNWRLVLKIQGLILIVLSFTMLFPIIFSLYYSGNDLKSLVFALLITLFSGLALYFGIKKRGTIHAKEGFLIVALGWVFAALFGALPYYIHGSFGTYIDCVFEAMSGFTTTGATILSNIEIIPHGLLFWRSFTHWLGGMGIILLAIAILPILGLNTSRLYNAEVPGPTKDRISPKIKDTAKILWLIYFGLTVLQTILFLTAGMNLFNALCHSFGTLATGGFSTLNKSIAGFNSLYIEIITIVFMYLAGINFALHFQLLRGKIKDFLKDREWRFYTAVLLIAITAIAFNIHSKDYSAEELAKHPELLGYTRDFGKAIRDSAFQVVSITTTTGYITADFNIWPVFSGMLLVILMFFGGSAGSTGGGIKQIRILIIFKHVINEIKRLSHPKGVFAVKVGNSSIENYVVRNVLGFFVIFMIFFAAITLFLNFQGYDIVTSFSASIAALGNIGPGLSRVGAIENYAFFNQITKVVLTFAMLLGRLEIFSVLILFYAIFGRKF